MTQAGTKPLFHFALAGLIAVYLCISLYQISSMALIDPDEPRYAMAGRTMSRGGSWLIPEFNGTPRINKPPLFYWLVAVSDTLCGGASDASARYPSVAMGLLMLLAAVFLGRSLFDESTGLWAGAILATMPLFMVLCRLSVTDMTLAALLTGTLCALMMGELGRWTAAKSVWTATAFFGPALLTKATAALPVLVVVLIDRALSVEPARRPAAARFIPGLLILAGVVSWISTEYNNPIFGHMTLAAMVAALLCVAAISFRATDQRLPTRNLAVGFVVALAIGLSWYTMLIASQGWERFASLLHEEIGGRLAGMVHPEPAYYYLKILGLVTFPWCAGLPAAVLDAWADVTGASGQDRRANRFLLAWVLGVLLFFSIPGSKLMTYLLPAMPAIALLVARFISRPARPTPLRQTLKKLTAALAVLLVIVCAIGMSGFTKRFPSIPLDSTALIMVCMMLVAWPLMIFTSRPMWAMIPAFLMIVFTCVHFPLVLTGMNRRSTRDVCLASREKISDCSRVVFVGKEYDSVPYYLDRTVMPAVRQDEARKYGELKLVLDELARPEKVALFIQDHYYARLINVDPRHFDAASTAKLAGVLPASATIVARGSGVVVVRN